MQQNVLIAALAGLLHDIGKFAYRAHVALDEVSQGFTTEDYGVHGAHAKWSAQFATRCVPQVWRKELGALLYHHKPNDLMSKVVALADQLSAGERSDEQEEQPKQQLSIFCQLAADGKRLEGSAYWPLEPLEFGKTGLFPGPAWSPEQVDKGYRELWAGFAEEADQLHRAHGANGDLPSYLESMLLLLQRYAWCVPSAYYRAQPDVSLYDHSRMTAALAAIVITRSDLDLDTLLQALRTSYPARRGTSQAELPSVMDQTQIGCLVGGDISGVQDFIYTITSRGATSALRGRSFYLQLLTEAIARFLLRELGVPVTNLIYAGGGHFYLLAPPEAGDQLVRIQQAVSRVLLHHHGGDLYVALGQVPLNASDFFHGRIAERWGELTSRLRQAKEQRFSELGADMHALVFRADTDQGNQEKECQVCGREHLGTKVVEEIRKCPQCVSYEELGERLRAARFLRLEELGPEPSQRPAAGSWSDVLADLGMAAWLGAALPKEPLTDKSVRSTLLALSDDAVQELKPEARLAVGRRMLVNVTPTYRQADHDEVVGKVKELPRPGSVKPFSVMAEQAQGIKRLGILRMDVDNLGRLFSEGFKGPEGSLATLSRVAALSFAMSMFFEGWLEQLIEQTNEETRSGCDRLYSIYAGGDDLFVMGSWDAVPVLALAIRDSFARFAANHPGVHLSGGIALAPEKYPLYQAAEDAKQAEDQAKAYRSANGQGNKNAITFLGKTVRWETFTQVKTWKDRLYALCHQEKRAPEALLRLLIQLQQEHDEALDKRSREGRDRNQANQPQVCFGPWMPRAAYMLKRMQDRHKEAKQELQELADTLAQDSFSAIGWIGLAARWAELLGRRAERKR